MDWDSGTEVIAQVNYAGAGADDLAFKKDEVLRIVSRSKDVNWLRAENRDGCEGLIPVSYVKRRPRLNLERMEFFHGDVSRAETERLLRGADDGRYLVRHSANFPGDFTLSISYRAGVEHYRIQQKPDKTLTCDDEEFFSTLPQLIQHYEADADGLCCRLRTAIPARGFQPAPRSPLAGGEGTDLPDAARPRARNLAASAWAIPRSALSLGDAIGRGEFADVHIGIYQGRKVAVKAIKAQSSPELSESLVKEASLMTSLRHKNLVELLGVVMEDMKGIWVVTEYMPNGSLVDYLRSRGRQHVTQTQQISFACDVCEGMAFLESKNVVHRDLAARNVLLAEDMRAKVSDFGLAKSADVSSVNDDANGKFPIKWTAPEALRFSNFSSKSDMWSFGVLLWEIYSFGRVPYPRIPIQDVVRHIEKGYRMEPVDGCPTDVTALMTDAWALNAIHRPSFKQMLVRLQTIEAGASPS